MTIDEAIIHAREVADSKYKIANLYHDDYGVYDKEESRCISCAEEHEQLAEWLEELKLLRTTKETMYREIYNQALEELAEFFHRDYVFESICSDDCTQAKLVDMVDGFVEQLKE